MFRFLLILMLFAIPTNSLSAQVRQPAPGLPFQVMTADRVLHVGTFGSADELSVRLWRPDGEEVEFFRSNVLDTRIRTANADRGFRAFGWVVAATAVGFGSYAAATWEPCRECWIHPASRGKAFFGSAVLGGVLVGVPVGAIVGLLRVSAWESVPPAEWAPVPGGVAPAGRP
jgi:hypothetical protein